MNIQDSHRRTTKITGILDAVALGLARDWPSLALAFVLRRTPIQPRSSPGGIDASLRNDTALSLAGFWLRSLGFWGMVQTQVTAQGWLGATPEGRRPQIRGWRWGLARCCQLDPSYPALLTREIRELNHS